MTARLVVLASGSGSNLQALIDAVDEGELDATIEAVIVNREGAGARDRAVRHGLAESFVPLAPYREGADTPRAAREAYDADLATHVLGYQPDVVVLAGWMHLFTQRFLDHFPGRVVNLHPALPGEFPGAHAIDDAWDAHVESGLERTGVMVHLVPDEGVDDGPVLASCEVPIHADDDRASLEERIHKVEHVLLVAAVNALVTS